MGVKRTSSPGTPSLATATQRTTVTVGLRWTWGCGFTQPVILYGIHVDMASECHSYTSETHDCTSVQYTSVTHDYTSTSVINILLFHFVVVRLCAIGSSNYQRTDTIG